MSYQKQDLIRYRIEKSLTTFEEAKSLSRTLSRSTGGFRIGFLTV
jgi:hypothetical protein